MLKMDLLTSMVFASHLQPSKATRIERLTNIKDSNHPSAMACFCPSRWVYVDYSVFIKTPAEYGLLWSLKRSCENKGKLVTISRFIM